MIPLMEINFNSFVRDIAQFGRAPALGAGCRRFKSYYPEESFFSLAERLESLV